MAHFFYLIPLTLNISLPESVQNDENFSVSIVAPLSTPFQPQQPLKDHVLAASAIAAPANTVDEHNEHQWPPRPPSDLPEDAPLTLLFMGQKMIGTNNKPLKFSRDILVSMRENFDDFVDRFGTEKNAMEAMRINHPRFYVKFLTALFPIYDAFQQLTPDAKAFFTEAIALYKHFVASQFNTAHVLDRKVLENAEHKLVEKFKRLSAESQISIADEFPVMVREIERHIEKKSLGANGQEATIDEESARGTTINAPVSKDNSQQGAEAFKTSKTEASTSV